MPKRLNPFGDAAPLQYKSHIGTKEVDTGVNSHHNMKAVYDKTKAMLFQSTCPVRADSVRCTLSQDPELWGGRVRDEQSQDATGQMYLDSQGKLCGHCPGGPVVVSGGPGNSVAMVTRNGHVTNELSSHDTSRVQLQLDSHGHLCPGQRALKSTPHRGLTTGFKICQSCNRPSHMGARTCGFCERMTCPNCLRQCHMCQGLFCQLCSILNYEESFEKAYCLHCAS